jgi:hypothetical protein
VRAQPLAWEARLFHLAGNSSGGRHRIAAMRPRKHRRIARPLRTPPPQTERIQLQEEEISDDAWLFSPRVCRSPKRHRPHIGLPRDIGEVKCSDAQRIVANRVRLIPAYGIGTIHDLRDVGQQIFYASSC